MSADLGILASLQGRHLLSLRDWSAEEVERVLELARRMKEGYARDRQPLRGKVLGLLFAKPSTRTRVSFEVAMLQLGGHALYLSAQELQLSRGEPLSDTARVLGRYLDALVIRTHAHAQAEELARWAGIPVINGLTDREHPCQALADMLTLWERKGRLRGLRLAFVGDGASNVAHSLIHAAAKLGVTLVVGCPPGYEPSREVLAEVEADMAASGAAVEVTHDPEAAVRGADAVYTDVWVSMGHEGEREQRMRDFAGFTVDGRLMALAQPDAVFLHCLPARRGEEVAEEVLEGPQSAVWDQAENRLHVQKAVLVCVLGGIG